jgi:indolepyruvate ferredoxin oxidoreductase, alpha subunit
MEKMFLMGNEAVALGAMHAGVARGMGYPGTPSTEILEAFSALGCLANWSPNEKVAAEVALGMAFTGARALVTMKHVGLNVAADVLYTAAYSGVDGALVFAVADDPGMASSQNEQDTRRHAVAAGVPILEPCDSQQAYDMTRLAFELSERWGIPVILRLTTRICHSGAIVAPRAPTTDIPSPHFERDIAGHVMIPGHARPAHRRLRRKLHEIAEWNEKQGPNRVVEGGRELGIISSGVVCEHCAEAAPQASLLKIGMAHPLPIEKIRAFRQKVERCLVVEENDPYLAEAILAAGVDIERAPELYRFGELNVERVRRIVAGDVSPENPPPKAKPPQLCQGCPHIKVFEVLRRHDCIVAGDIGCYTLGALPPYEAMDTQICMGASLGVGLGMRHCLPAEEARRVVSVIGDSTFVHSGLTGLAEMAYNIPATGHVLVILDNSTTAMTGHQEHPGTGRLLDHSETRKLDFAAVARAMGIDNVLTVDPVRETERFEQELLAALAKDELSVIIAQRPCILSKPAGGKS